MEENLKPVEEVLEDTKVEVVPVEMDEERIVRHGDFCVNITEEGEPTQEVRFKGLISKYLWSEKPGYTVTVSYFYKRTTNEEYANLNEWIQRNKETIVEGLIHKSL